MLPIISFVATNAFRQIDKEGRLGTGLPELHALIRQRYGAARDRGIKATGFFNVGNTLYLGKETVAGTQVAIRSIWSPTKHLIRSAIA
jgi:hypothetical protein